ncbi:YopX family protein [Campylobacter concisus]
MREIKFRVWSILNAKMLSWADIFHLPAWEIFPGTPEQRAFIVMQYTGLKDKNDKEIYGKDILQFSNGNLGEVIWSHLRAGFDVAFANAMPEELDNNLASDCVVVGNIYENKELLE